MDDSKKTKAQLITELGTVETEQKKMAEVFKEGEDKYRLLFENTPLGIAYCKMIFDKDNKPVDWIYLDVNNSFEILTGLKDIVGKRVTEAIPGIKEDSPEVFETYGNVALTGEKAKFEMYLNTLKIWFSINVYRLQEGYFVAVFDNITEKKSEEEDLKESETMLQMSQEIGKIGSFEMSLVSGNVKWSNQLYKLFGLKKAGKNIDYEKVLALIHPDDREHAIKVSSNAVEQGKSYELEHRIIRSDGEVLDLLVKGDVIYNENNEKIKIVGTTQDITKRKKAEKQIKASLEEKEKLIQDLKKEVTERKKAEEALKRAHDELEIRVKEQTSELTKANNELLFDITERKKAEEALKESETHLSNALRIAKLGHWEFDVKENHFTFNDEFYSIFHTSAEKMGGYTMSPERYTKLFVHPDDTSVVATEIQKAIETTDPNYSRQLEHRMFYADGSIGYIAVRFRIIKDGEGHTIKTFGVNQDITELKKVEKKLLESEEKFRSLFNNAEIGIFRTRLDGSEMLDMNDKFIEIFGYTREEMKGKPSVIHWEDTREREEMARRLTADGRVTNYECRMLNKQGDVFNCITSLKLYQNLGILEGSILDITDRKLAEESLRKSEDMYHSILQTAMDGYWLVDHNGRLLDVNPAYSQMSGYSREELLEMTIPQLEAKEKSEDVATHIQKIIKKGADSFESLHRRKDGSTFDVEIGVTFVPKYDGYFVVIIRDITERKQLEEERMKTEKLESIGILAGGIAHDFNNILAVILGNTSLAKISLDNKSEVLELLTETENASVRATKLTQQLLTFAKGGAPVKEITGLTELIRETARFSLRGSNVQYRDSFPPDLWTAEVDKGQINQAVGNLVINAKQAMPEGGKINIKAKNVTVTPEDNLPLREGNYVKISFEDKGSGITVEHLSKIFDPYFTTKQMGSGLGLATTYSIIHRHNGHIAVESELGVGTTFHIYLPASSKQLEEKEAVKGESAVMTGKILVMDDEESIRKILGNILTSLGNEVEVASDGTEAIEKYKKAMKSGKPFDVVIMDLTIPGGMGGEKAIRKLLEIDPDAKAVVSSGYANDPVVSNFEAYGFSGFIPKPYKLEELKKVLNEVLSDKQ